MKRELHIYFFAVALSSLSSFTYAAPITLKDAYQAALVKTETVPIQSSIVNQYQAMVRGAQGGILPTMTLGANATRQDTPPGSFNDPWQTYTRATLFQPIYQGGRNSANIKYSKSLELAQEKNMASSMNDLFSTVSESFYSLLSGIQDAANIEETIKVSQDRIKELERQAKIGRSKKTDTLAAQAQLLVLQSQLQTSQRNMESTRDGFAFLTGLDRNVQLDENIVIPEKIDPLENFLRLLESRPDVESLRYQVNAQKHNISLAKSAYLPLVGFTGNYYFTRTGSQINRGNWDIGFGLTMPLYQGGIVRSQVRQASEIQIQTELLLRQKLRDANSQIHQIYGNLVNTIEQIKTLEKAFTVTEQNYRAQSKDYKFGLVTNLDVIEALNTYLETKRTLDQSKFEAMIFYSQLRAITNQVQSL